MRQETINIYTFEELSPKAQATAIEKNYDINISYDWWDFIYEDAKNIGLKITGFDLTTSAGVSGELTADFITVCNRIKENFGDDCETYKAADKALTAINAQLVATTLINTTNSWDEFHDSDIYYQTAGEFKDDILNAYRDILSKEYYYLTSAEAISETLISNEYEFTEDGNPYKY